MGNLDHFRNVLRDAVDAASFGGSVFKTGLRHEFDKADNGIKNEPTPAVTSAPDVGRPFNM